MREGNNPIRNKKIENNDFSHRIIVPVFIPNLKGYYTDSFIIFKLCIQSILKTTNKQTAVTIINNGSCLEIIEYLNELFTANLVDEVINTQKVGKLNAILKGIRSSKEPYITITDADVLFKQNWLKETMDVFRLSNKVGVVGIVPQFKMYENLAHNVIFDNIFNKNLKFTKVKDIQGLKAFYKSIGWNDDYNKDYLEYNLSIQNKDKVKALVGSGHFVATYKRNIFDNNLPFSNFLLGGESESLYLDLPVSKKNLWRLTTESNFAFHMGNKLEDWMTVFENSLNNYEPTNISFLKIKNKILKNKPLIYFFKQRVFSKIFVKRWFKKLFYNNKGLPKEAVKNY